LSLGRFVVISSTPHLKRGRREPFLEERFRESLYRMLSKKGNPEIKSLYTLLHAMGLWLAAINHYLEGGASPTPTSFKLHSALRLGIQRFLF
jgi:hypothetical protein